MSAKRWLPQNSSRMTSRAQREPRSDVLEHDRQDQFGPGIAARYPDGLVPQGISAELIAAKWELPRSDLDRFSLESHQRAAAATDAGRFADEIAPIDGVAVDESIRPETTLEVLAGLKPAFEDESMSARFP